MAETPQEKEQRLKAEVVKEQQDTASGTQPKVTNGPVSGDPTKMYGIPKPLHPMKPSGPKSVGDPKQPQPEMSTTETQITSDGRRVTGSPALAKGGKIVKPD